MEIARARNVLRRFKPQSELLKVDDTSLLVGVDAIHEGRVTRTGLLLFGNRSLLTRICPQHQVHYAYHTELEVIRNDSFQDGLLNILERIEQAFTGPANPVREVSVGLFKMRIPAFPVEVVREALLNAVTHRDYTDPGEVLLRHTARELAITSPGGFLAGITPQNILRHEPVARNRILAAAFEKLGMVERAGMGRRRIFIPTLSYGMRMPEYLGEAARVTLRVFDGTFDEQMAKLAAKWRGEGREIDLDALLVLSFLTGHAFIDVISGAELLQVPSNAARGILDQLALPQTGILERKGRTAHGHVSFDAGGRRRPGRQGSVHQAEGHRSHPLPRVGAGVRCGPRFDYPTGVPGTAGVGRIAIGQGRCLPLLEGVVRPRRFSPAGGEAAQGAVFRG